MAHTSGLTRRIGDEEYYTIADVMRRYHVGRRVVYKWADSGLLRLVRFGVRGRRVAASDLARFERNYVR